VALGDYEAPAASMQSLRHIRFCILCMAALRCGSMIVGGRSLFALSGRQPTYCCKGMRVLFTFDRRRQRILFLFSS